MDENKEILTSENEAENTNTDTTAETTENTTFVADEPTESEEMSFAETEPVNENGVTAPQPKKKEYYSASYHYRYRNCCGCGSYSFRNQRIF